MIERRHLRQHLELAAQAYGSDLQLPAGTVVGRTARTEPPAAAALDPATGPPSNPGQADPAPIEPIESASTAASTPATSPSTEATRTTLPSLVAQASKTTPPPTQRPAAAPAAAGDPATLLQELRREVQPCTRCKLHEGRQHTVFGEGDPAAEVMFIGEAPGAREDQTGRPFVGEAGQLLDRILVGAMGLQRSEVYIANVNKCRPPGNRVPEPDEVAACLPFLRQQIAIVRPKVLVCLGRTAAQNLLATTASTTALRGRDLSYEGIPVVVTWHPAYLLREPAHKRETWEDIKRVNRLLGRPEVPPSAG